MSISVINPPTHQEKQEIVSMYGESYKILIETGTYLGQMVTAQINHFEIIYSIELSNALYQQACERFKNASVNLYNGDSGIILPQILKFINQPVLFWLDGHYSSGITAKGDKETPIREELQAIMKHPCKHTILIDDARCFTGQNDYPTISQIGAMAPGYTVTIKDDIIRLT